MKFKRFTKHQFLASIGREHLRQLLARFAADITARGLSLPDPGSSDDAYLTAVATLALAPAGLPDELIDTLFMIEEMATAEGQERLEAAAAEAGLNLELGEHASHGDIAVQVWLAKPTLLVETHRTAQLGRLSAFDYYGSTERADVSAAFTPPTKENLEALSAELDVWFREHNRGHRLTRIQSFELDGEFWFLVRHGDTFCRTRKLVPGGIEVLHFWPAKDDVVVYTPHRDEIRIHAGTKGEKQLYRRTFGKQLRGSESHFCHAMTYTLEPLRTEGMDALDAGESSGIQGIGLREVELAWPETFRDTVVRKSDDVFLSAMTRRKQAIPSTGRLVRAAFDVKFKGASKPRRVEVRTPNTLKLGRECDARLIHRWLSERGFRTSAELNLAA